MAQKFWRIRFKFVQCILNCNFVKFVIYLPLKSVWPFIWTNLNPLHQRMHCARFLNFIIIISLYRNYLPLEKDVAIHWPILNSLHPSLLWAKFGWNYPSDSWDMNMWKVYRQTDRQTESDGRRTTCDQTSSLERPSMVQQYTLFNFLFFSCKIMSNWYYTQNSIREGTDEQKTK